MEPATAPIPVVEKVAEQPQEVQPVIVVKTQTEVSNNVVDDKKEVTVETDDGRGVQESGSSLMPSIINMMNTIVGAGTISLPSSFLISGLGGGTILMVISVILSLYGAHYLSAASIYAKDGSYGGVGSKVVNHSVGIAADLFMILFDFGIAIGYSNIVFAQTIEVAANLMDKSVDDIIGWKPVGQSVDQPIWVAIVECLLIFFPILSIKTIDALKFTSTIAIVCIVLFVFISIFLGIKQVFTQPLDYVWFPKNFTDFSTAIAVFFTCFCAHVNIPQMTGELKFPAQSKFSNKLKKMDRVNCIAFIACSLIYLFVGVCGYLAFGSNTQGSLLSNFTELNVWYLNIVKIAYALVALFSYPVLSFSPLVSIDKMLFKTERTNLRRILEALIWSVLCLIVALAIPQLNVIFALTGSLCGGALLLIFPALFFIYINKREKAKEQTSRLPMFSTTQANITLAWIFFYLGIVLAVFLTALEIKKLIPQ